jgi:hypothetical protein
MSSASVNRHSDLPEVVPLLRYAPERSYHSWKVWGPELVLSISDLPQYLVLGGIDSSQFQLSSDGWFARWQGNEDDTYFDVTYKAKEKRWEVQQTWCGIDGGLSRYPAHIPLDKLIAQALYMQFPSSWDRSAKTRLEKDYQLTLIEQPQNGYNLFGLPDGAFRTIVFPISVRNLRRVREWIQSIITDSPLTYPISVEAKLFHQVINYLEGKAPEWTSQTGVAFLNSLEETGLAPHDFPVREVAKDGSAAWTLRRDVYFICIGLPFAGLVDFLSRMSSENGPVRTTYDPSFRFELCPIIIPAGFEIQTESLAVWDKARTTRSFLQFARLGDEKIVRTVEDVIESEIAGDELLAKAEEISGDIVKSIDQIFKQVTQGGSS